MPIYEYRCAACGHTLEALQKLADSPLKKCPECKKQSLKRLMSAPSFRLKGGGWYETDFKSDGEKKRNLVESPAASAKESLGSDDSKPVAAKPDSAKPDTPKADTATKDSKSKESPSAGAKDAKPAAKEPAAKKSSSKPSAARPAST